MLGGGEQNPGHLWEPQEPPSSSLQSWNWHKRPSFDCTSGGYSKEREYRTRRSYLRVLTFAPWKC